ncbi:MAG TPA: hypothetical protein VL992_15915 [Tepidisphaeraceae bacterium]|nr:hypothetical protein [Tepidisphaeraceae bacterium]
MPGRALGAGAERLDYPAGPAEGFGEVFDFRAKLLAEPWSGGLEGGPDGLSVAPVQIRESPPKLPRDRFAKRSGLMGGLEADHLHRIAREGHIGGIAERSEGRQNQEVMEVVDSVPLLPDKGAQPLKSPPDPSVRLDDRVPIGGRAMGSTVPSDDKERIAALRIGTLGVHFRSCPAACDLQHPQALGFRSHVKLLHTETLNPMRGLST